MSWDVQTHSGDACCDMMSLLHQLSHCQHCQHAGNYVALSFDYSLLSKDTHTQIVTRTHIHSVTHTHAHQRSPSSPSFFIFLIFITLHIHTNVHKTSQICRAQRHSRTTFDGFVTCTTAVPNTFNTHKDAHNMHSI